ncbi:MAG: STAS domain-containing protein [Synechocystis sp.]|nr:STAS domain-containing protein [Synechocystis sp.]
MQFKPQLLEPNVFRPQGSLSAAVTDHFQQDLKAWLASASADALVIDFAMVDFLDSSTLVVLVDAYKQTRQAGKRLMLSGVSPELKIIFELTQLDTVFAIYTTPDAAFESLNPVSMAA